MGVLVKSTVRGTSYECQFQTSIAQDKPWALYLKAKVGVAETDAAHGPAMEDKCELCFKTWKRAFPTWAWADLVKKKNQDVDFASYVDKARQKIANGDDPDPGPSVASARKLTWEVSRKFMMVTEKDLRAKLGVPRISKYMLKTLTAVQIPAEDGSGDEVAFVFKHASAELRELTLRCSWQTELHAPVLAQDSL